MCRTKHLLTKTCLKYFYFAFIHSYLNYCNIGWASTYHSTLKKVYIVQKKSARLILDMQRYTEARPLLKSLSILNVYQLNILQILIFMFKHKNNMLPDVFKSLFSAINHKYPTRHSNNNYIIPKTVLRKTDFTITTRGPRLWKLIPTIDLKNCTSLTIFKPILKRQLLNIHNETDYF